VSSLAKKKTIRTEKSGEISGLLGKFMKDKKWFTSAARSVMIIVDYTIKVKGFPGHTHVSNKGKFPFLSTAQ
jgi:hypothetical protein